MSGNVSKTGHLECTILSKTPSYAFTLGCPKKVKMVIDIPKHFALVLNREKINTVKSYLISTTFTGSTKSRLFEQGNTCKVYVVLRRGTICSKKEVINIGISSHPSLEVIIFALFSDSSRRLSPPMSK